MTKQKVYQWLKVTNQNGVVEVKLNRPAVRNAFSPAMIAELANAFAEIAADPSNRLVVLSGEGPVFCAGADLTWMKESIQYDETKNQTEARDLFAMFANAAACPVPVIACIQGAAFGGGLGLVACADFVLAAEKTKLCFSEVKLGIVPAVISGFVLAKSSPGLVGPWMISGQVFSCADGLRMGLVHQLVAEDLLTEALEELTRDFLRAGPEATRKTKALLRQMNAIDSLQASEDLCTKLIAEVRVSAEGQEGLKAFLEKREPQWRTT
ncbi:MAG: enoyl-CoA hydratase [Bdellovibrio sp.]|nr:MAG: enoyl-CoA hydratase [Bdellovibrio sp.]